MFTKMNINQFIMTLFFFFFTCHLSVFAQTWFVDWSRQYDNFYQGDGNDEVTSIVVDNQGNVYVTGMGDYEGENNYGFTPIATVKYDANGNFEWVSNYPQSGPGESEGNSITVYYDGNNSFIYVTGRKWITSDNSEFVTLKYEVDGDLLWARTYNGSGDYSQDVAYHIEVDADGSAYVTGVCYNGSNYDYVTIKYNSSGVQQWVMPYDGGANDTPSSLKLINGGSIVYVTGTSNNGTNNDIVTVAYFTSDGGDAWESPAVYNSGNNDYGNDIAVVGEVYVIGTTGSGKITTIAYDSENGGNPLWYDNYYDGEGKSIGVYRKPCAGNMYCWTPEVFVTGISGSYGITIGYDENGDVLTGWPRYNSNSEFYSLAVDFNGNIAVSGTDENETDLVTVQYDDAGNENFNLTCTTYASYGHTVTVDDNGYCMPVARVSRAC